MGATVILSSLRSGKFAQLCFGLSLVVVSGLAWADGRIEINQSSVEAAGGFPFIISQPGNYVLTGSLTVPADTDGLYLTGNEVVIDLNGFSISGPATCSSGACQPGTGSGVRGSPGITGGARRSTVRNGTVRGFGRNCVELAGNARVEDLLVTECGKNGIVATNGSVVMNNRVLQTGEYGILMNGGLRSSFGGNTVALAGLADGGHETVLGGTPNAGNSCDDQACSSTGKRRYYLTEHTVLGDAVNSACDAGYRVARVFEIWAPSSLEYDFNRGVDIGRSHGKNFIFFDGWGNAGVSHCLEWTSTSNQQFGVAMALYYPADSPNEKVPWRVRLAACDIERSVWCVEE